MSTPFEYELAEMVGGLKEKNSNLLKRNEELEKELEQEKHRFDSAHLKTRITDNIDSIITKTWKIFVTILGLTLILSAPAYSIYKNFTTPYEVTHCSIDEKNGVHGKRTTLIGVVPWHIDRNYGIFESNQAAVEAAQQMGCEIR